MLNVFVTQGRLPEGFNYTVYLLTLVRAFNQDSTGGRPLSGAAIMPFSMNWILYLCDNLFHWLHKFIIYCYIIIIPYTLAA